MHCKLCSEDYCKKCVDKLLPKDSGESKEGQDEKKDEDVKESDKKEETSKPESEDKTEKKEEKLGSPPKKQKVEFKIDPESKEKDDGDKTTDEQHKITILEPQEIIELLMILDNTDESSIEKTKQLKQPLKLIRNEMKISESKNLQETKESISKAFKHMMGLKHSDDDFKPFCQSKVNIIQHPFTDKLMCLKDSYYLKLLHRDGVSDEFKFNA